MINAREHLFRHGSVEGALIFTQPIARFADRTRGNTSDQARSARRAGLGVQFVDFLQKLTLPPSLPSSSRPRYTDCPNGVSGTLILAVTDANCGVCLWKCVWSSLRSKISCPSLPPSNRSTLPRETTTFELLSFLGTCLEMCFNPTWDIFRGTVLKPRTLEGDLQIMRRGEDNQTWTINSFQ